MFLTRLVTALVLLPVFIGALLLLPNAWWALFLAPWIAAGAWEWGGLAGYARGLRAGYCALVVAAYAGWCVLGRDIPFAGQAACWAAVVFWALAVPWWLARRLRVTGAGALGVAGFLVLLPCAVALVELQARPVSLLVFMGIVWIADSAAYCAGRLFGRRKLAPAISPGKTWEGVVGALLVVCLYYFLNQILADDTYTIFSGWSGLVVFAAVTVASIEGDLFESWIKRQAGVKDSGALLPGHGGVLDRIDGLTPSMPLVALAVAILG